MGADCGNGRMVGGFDRLVIDMLNLFSFPFLAPLSFGRLAMDGTVASQGL